VGSSDNYAYLVTDEKSKEAVIIDPAHPDEYERPFWTLVTLASELTAPL
jgi:glyoxylase-like metal-dependent hydrolase (beta-lactamase superfamily II)